MKHLITLSPLLLCIMWCSVVVSAIPSSDDQVRKDEDNTSNKSLEELIHSTLGLDDILLSYTSLSTANVLFSPHYSVHPSSSSGSSSVIQSQKIARLILNPIRRSDGSIVTYYGYHELEGRPVDIAGISIIHGRKTASCNFISSRQEDDGSFQKYEDMLLAQQGIMIRGPLMEVQMITCEAPAGVDEGT